MTTVELHNQTKISLNDDVASFERYQDVIVGAVVVGNDQLIVDLDTRHTHTVHVSYSYHSIIMTSSEALEFVECLT